MEWLLTGTGHERTFWNDGNVLSFDRVPAAWVCVCDLAVPLRFMHFAECKLYQEKKKKLNQNPYRMENMGLTDLGTFI